MKTSFLKNQNLRLILIALFLGVVAALLTRTYIASTIQAVTGGRLSQVVFTTGPIRAGTPVKNADLEMRSIPDAYLSSRAVRWSMRNLLIGQTLQNDLAPAQGVLWSDVHLTDDIRLEDRLPINERAVTLKVDQTGALNGMISPGNRVDILVQTRSKGAQITKMVAQNMTIIAIDNRLTARNAVQASNASAPQQKTEPPIRVSSVTFRASPQDAMLLAFAETQGRIVLLLRNDGDIFSEPVPQVSNTELTSAQPFTGLNNNAPTQGFPTIYEPGDQPRSGALPSASDLATKLKNMTPEDAKKQILQQFKAQTEGDTDEEEEPASTPTPAATPKK